MFELTTNSGYKLKLKEVHFIAMNNEKLEIHGKTTHNKDKLNIDSISYDVFLRKDIKSIRWHEEYV